MSLVRTMLSGVYESTNYIESMNIRDDVYVSEDGMYDPYGDKANEALVFELYQIDRAYHVADVIGEVKVLTEGADPEVLLEAMGGSAVSRIKAAFKKFWEKIKSWFASVKRQLHIMFKTGKDFIKEFKAELNKKTAKGYSYNTYKYTIDTGDGKATAYFESVQTEIDTVLGKDFDIDKASTQAISKRSEYGDESKHKDISDIQEDFIKKYKSIIPADEMDDIRTELTDIYHDGDSEKSEYEDFESNSKSYMISFVETFDKKVKDMEKKEREYDKTMNRIIKAFEKLEKKDMPGTHKEVQARQGTSYDLYTQNPDGSITSERRSKPGTPGVSKAEADKLNEQDSTGNYNSAQYIARKLNAYLAIYKIPCDVQQSIYKEAASEFEKVLKGYLRFKPAKESYYYDEDYSDSVNESTNIFEQAMKMI